MVIRDATQEAVVTERGAARWEAPIEFDEYRIERFLGAGAMGIVYLAHDTLLDRPVAIKFIAATDVAGDKRQRFFTEARAVARLSHPNVVAVYRVGEVRQRPYLVSEYVRGTPLAAMAKPIAWQRALKIGIGLARGLGAAHRCGVLHRDIKPANIVVGNDDEPKLLDFGLAKLLDTGTASQIMREARPRGDRADPLERSGLESTISMERIHEDAVRHLQHEAAATHVASASRAGETAEIVGTPLYLAPELWRGAPASAASDVYALGVVLYEVLAGRPPHAGATLSELSVRVATEDIPRIATQVANLPIALSAIIDACTRRDPTARPSSGDAVAELLAAVASPSADDKHDGKRERVAVLHAHLRGYRRLMQTQEPSELATQLNQYLEAIADAITSHGGTTDKFIGYAVTGVFRRHLQPNNAAEAALDAALAMCARLQLLNQHRFQAGLLPLHCGIGISFGDVAFSAVGTGAHKQLTILGDIVPVAPLLVTATKSLGMPIAMSEALALALPAERRATLTESRDVMLKGEAKPMTIFSIGAEHSAGMSPRPTT